MAFAAIAWSKGMTGMDLKKFSKKSAQLASIGDSPRLQFE
jgi:hypothetical protein